MGCARGVWGRGKGQGGGTRSRVHAGCMGHAGGWKTTFRRVENHLPAAPKKAPFLGPFLILILWQHGSSGKKHRFWLRYAVFWGNLPPKMCRNVYRQKKEPVISLVLSKLPNLSRLLIQR